MHNGDQLQIRCPYCGELTDVHVDSAEDEADLVEDCTVCCRPIRLYIEDAGTGTPKVLATRESE